MFGKFLTLPSNKNVQEKFRPGGLIPASSTNKGDNNHKRHFNASPDSKGVAELRKHFMEHDIDHNGQLSRTELKHMLEMHQLDIPKAIMTNIHATIETNGYIRFRQLVQAFPCVAEIDKLSAKPARLSEKEISLVCKHFWSCDENSDGVLSKDEFANLISSLGMEMDEEELKHAFSCADKDKNGRVSFHEFTESYLGKDKASKLFESQIKEIFCHHDEDKKGYLLMAECTKALRALGNYKKTSDILKIMRKMDGNRDGKISFKEFCQFLDIDYRYRFV